MEQTRTTMGRRIAQRRKELNMTQDALARKLGVSAQAVSKWEHDLSCPDISLLPQLANILGITTDELLGGAPEAKTPVLEAEVVPDGDPDGDSPGIHFENDRGQKFDIHFDTPKRASFSAAAWLICTALLMLAGPVLKINETNAIGFWGACWISALIVWGVGGMIRRIRFTNVVAALSGFYFALEGLGVIDLDLGWEVVFPLLILLLGVSLLFDGLGRKRRKGSVFHVSCPSGGFSSDIRMDDGFLSYSNSFGEDHYRVQTPRLTGGDVSVSFGEHVLDFSGVESVAENCRLEVNSSFGEVCLRIPRRYRAELTMNKSFADASVHGQPDPEPEGVIYVTANLSFGEMTVHYI